MSNPIPVYLALCDDDTAVTSGFKRVIEKKVAKNFSNIKLTLFSNGHDCIEALKNSSPPQILLLDITMPGMNGFEVLKWIRTESPHNVRGLAVVMFTSSTMSTDQERAMELGCSDFLTKPTNRSLWPTFIESLINRFVVNRRFDPNSSNPFGG